MIWIVINIKNGKPTGDVFYTEGGAQGFNSRNSGTTYTAGRIR